MTSGKLLPAGGNAVSHLTQSELPTVRPTSAPCLHAFPLWQIVVLAALSLWLYGPTLIHLIRQWGHDPNFSHGLSWAELVACLKTALPSARAIGKQVTIYNPTLDPQLYTGRSMLDALVEGCPT